MTRLITPLLAALLLVAPAFGQAQDAKTILERADAYRAGAVNSQLETEVVILNAAGQADKTRRYSVFIRDARQSLILMRSPAEAGQKVLMAGDDYWLVLPGSERPMRISPAQKLLGDASTGDIASLSWASDYEGTIVGEETCKLDSGERACRHLSLTATRKGTSYQRIELWVGVQRHEPLMAQYYLQSDKLAKHARFTLDDAAAPKQVTEMILRDELSDKKVTVVKYLSRAAKVAPEAWFNPMFLARTQTLE